MVCWLRFLKLVSDTIKDIEPNLLKRKRLAIEVLKDIEKEEGHDIEKIREAIEREGKEGLIRRAEKLQGKKEEGKEKEETKGIKEKSTRKKKKKMYATDVDVV